MTVSSINRSDNQSHSPVFIDFKPWRKSMQSCIHALGAIDQCVTGGTPDYSSIYNAIDDLSKRNEHRRILFIITDANGYNHQHMEHLQKLADKLGVVLIVIGINSRDVSCFVNSVNVQDLDDLGSVAFNQLLKTVKRKIK
jgi:hypothetical protein